MSDENVQYDNGADVAPETTTDNPQPADQDPSGQNSAETPAVADPESVKNADGYPVGVNVALDTPFGKDGSEPTPGTDISRELPSEHADEPRGNVPLSHDEVEARAANYDPAQEARDQFEHFAEPGIEELIEGLKREFKTAADDVRADIKAELDRLAGLRSNRETADAQRAPEQA